MDQKNINPRAQSAAGAAPVRGGGYQITVFPPEFERHLLQELDKRFYIILGAALVFVYGVVFSLASVKYDAAKFDEQARQRYLEKFYQAALVTQEDIAAEEKEENTGEMTGQAEEAKVDARAQRYQGRGGTEAGGGASAREIAEGRRAAAAARGAARRAIESQIAGTGMLGVLSAGGGGTGDAVADVLGGAGGGGIGVGNLEDVLSGVGGLATATSAGQRTRVGSVGGGRATGSADVGELLSGIGASSSASVGRKGTIQMTLDAARVTGMGTKAANRSGEEISRTINTHNDAVEYCYKREAKLNPNLKGDILVEFVIGYDGRVNAARVTESSLQNKSVESCIISRVRGWRFKPISQAEGDVTVRQKYIFG
jgi:TonB family protein